MTMLTAGRCLALTLLLNALSACGPLDGDGDELSVNAASITLGSDDPAHPQVVALVKGNRVLCTGTLVAPSAVLSAAHCFTFNPPNEIVIGRYHSLYVERDSVPDVLTVTATTEDGVAMAIEHKTLPVGGVQFHPESLMSLGGEVGLRIVENAFRLRAN